MSMRPHTPYGLDNHGIRNPDTVYWTLPTPLLYDQAIRRREGHLAHLGPLVVRTGQYTGRSPRDRFIVDDPEHTDSVAWGKVNQPMSEDQFESLHKRLMCLPTG